MGWLVTDLILGLIGFVASVLIVLSIVGIGWYLVWKFFLSRFKFVRELLGNADVRSDEPTHQQRSRNHKRNRVD